MIWKGHSTQQIGVECRNIVAAKVQNMPMGSHAVRCHRLPEMMQHTSFPLTASHRQRKRYSSARRRYRQRRRWIIRHRTLRKMIPGSKDRQTPLDTGIKYSPVRCRIAGKPCVAIALYTCPRCMPYPYNQEQSMLPSISAK